jgi:hypothetical protein
MLLGAPAPTTANTGGGAAVPSGGGGSSGGGGIATNAGVADWDGNSKNKTTTAYQVVHKGLAHICMGGTDTGIGIDTAPASSSSSSCAWSVEIGGLKPGTSYGVTLIPETGRSESGRSGELEDDDEYNGYGGTDDDENAADGSSTSSNSGHNSGVFGAPSPKLIVSTHPLAPSILLWHAQVL